MKPLAIFSQLNDHNIPYCLLRGHELVVQSAKVNDLDIFLLDLTPKKVLLLSQIFKNKEILKIKINDQVKITTCGKTTLEIDFFHRITWRGFEFFTTHEITSGTIDKNGIYTLNSNSELCITILKEVLHNKKLKNWGGGAVHAKRLLHADKKAFYKMLSSKIGNIPAKVIVHRIENLRTDIPLYIAYMARIRVIISSIHKSPIKKITSFFNRIMNRL